MIDNRYEGPSEEVYWMISHVSQRPLVGQAGFIGGLLN